LLAVAAVGVGALVLPQVADQPSDDTDRDGVVAAEGRLDLDEGLRAYVSPGDRLYLGGTSVALSEGMGYLDTDAVATPYGLVYTDPDGQTMLLGEDGRPEPVGEPSQVSGDWHPTVKADAERPHIVFARLLDGDAVLTVFDLEKRSVVATTEITCPGGCTDLVLDGIDSGAVFVRMGSGTAVWDYDGRESYRFAGPDTRVADVRNQVVLYAGPEPTQTMPGWRYVPGEIDAQLSFDGKHVLSWSDTLEPTTPDGQPITLDLPKPATFFAFDTDGSVLAATAADPSHVFDCVLPSGACEPIGEMTTDHGDPLFIGADR